MWWILIGAFIIVFAYVVWTLTIKICPVCNHRCGHMVTYLMFDRSHRGTKRVWCDRVGAVFYPVVGVGGFVWGWLNVYDDDVDVYVGGTYLWGIGEG